MPIGAEPKRKGWRAPRTRECVSFQLCKRLRVNRRLSVELDAPVVSCLKEINMATIYHQVWINAPLAKVYDAISTLEGIVSWWGPHKSTKTETRSRTRARPRSNARRGAIQGARYGPG